MTFFWVSKHVPWSLLAVCSHGYCTRENGWDGAGLAYMSSTLGAPSLKLFPQRLSQCLKIKMLIQRLSFLSQEKHSVHNAVLSVSAFYMDFYRTLIEAPLSSPPPPPTFCIKDGFKNMLILYQNGHQNRSFNDPPDWGFYYFLPASKKQINK